MITYIIAFILWPVIMWLISKISPDTMDNNPFLFIFGSGILAMFIVCITKLIILVIQNGL